MLRRRPPRPAAPPFDAEDDLRRRRGPGGRGRHGHRHPPRPRARAGAGRRRPRCPSWPRRRGPPGEWALPPLSLLQASKKMRQDQRQIDALGEDLVRALEAHGVETRLVGCRVGPDGHPLRARARPRGQGGPGHQPLQGHRLRHGVARRAHPGAHPRQVGHRGRGAEPDPPAGVPARHPRVERGQAVRDHPPARGGHGPRHRRAAPSWRTWPKCRTSSSRARPARGSRPA